MSRKATLIFAAILAIVFLTVDARRTGAQLPGHFGATRAPIIAVDKSDNLYIAMSVATKPAGAGTPGSQTFFTISKDGGQSWNNLPFTKNLSKSKGEAFGPSISITRQGTVRVYIVYHDDSSGTTEGYLVRSKKKTKFRSPKNITPGDGGAFFPRVALDSTEAVNVVWGDIATGTRRVVFLRSTDQGASFSELRDISRSLNPAFNPEIAIDSTDAINVVWEDGDSSESDIMFSRSTDGGESFSDPISISAGGAIALEAHIAVDRQNRIHVSWIEERDGDFQVLYARSTDGGVSFPSPITVTGDEGEEFHKAFVAASGDTVFVAFQKDSGRNRQIFLAKSTDAGLNFAEAVQVSRADNSKGRAHSPAMVFDSDERLHIVWIDSSFVGNDEGLMVYSSTKDGTSFTPRQVIIAGLP